MKDKLILISVISGLFLFVGCSHEKLVQDMETRRPNENRPDWTINPPTPANGKVFFVGRSLAVNVLDEKHGINEAMDDAIYQIARAAGADVKGHARIVDTRRGEAIRGKEQTEQPSQDEVRVDVDGTVIGIRQQDVFWERYSVRKKFGLADILYMDEDEKFTRYKYYVLVSVPEAELKRLEEEKQKQQ